MQTDLPFLPAGPATGSSGKDRECCACSRNSALQDPEEDIRENSGTRVTRQILHPRSVINRPLAQILHQRPGRGIDDPDDLRALRDWVNAKQKNEAPVDAMYSVIRSSLWRVG